jgi:hypothetical protein
MSIRLCPFAALSLFDLMDVECESDLYTSSWRACREFLITVAMPFLKQPVVLIMWEQLLTMVDTVLLGAGGAEVVH